MRKKSVQFQRQMVYVSLAISFGALKDLIGPTRLHLRSVFYGNGIVVFLAKCLDLCLNRRKQFLRT